MHIARKFIFGIIFLFTFIFQLKADDSTSVFKNKKFGIGISSSPVSHTFWTNTDPYNIDKGSFIPFDTRAFAENGININWNFYKNLYFETGGNVNIEDIPMLVDNTNYSPFGTINQSVWLSYNVKYLQIPIAISYSSPHKTGFYLSIGVKNNFIYYENLNGWIKGSYVDEANNQLKFNNVVAFYNLGGNVFMLKNRLRFCYYFSMTTTPLYQEKNAIANFSFYKFGFNNIALFYNFNL